MGSIYKRGPFWWIAFKLPGGKRVMRSSGVSSSLPEVEARKVLREVEEQLANQGHREATSKMTLAEYAIQWTAERKSQKKTNAQRDFDRLELYVLPDLGAKRLRDIRATDIRAVVKTMKAREFAPRTIIDTHGLLRSLFKEAQAEGLIDATPCVLKKGELPKKRDKDPSWRAKAIFTREEAELLLSSGSIPLDRRVTYALGLLAGMREGEIAALRWGSFDRSSSPLPRLLVVASFTRHNGFEKGTKTGNPREVPVHAVLSRILTEWEERGFAEMFGREPRETDLLIPNRWGSHRIDSNFWQGLHADLKALGLRHRRMHDTRRTFISLARTDGANGAVLKTVTHDQEGDVFDQYTTFTFDAKCEAVSMLKLTGRAVRVARAKAVGVPSYTPATQRENVMRTEDNRRTFSEPRTGVEPGHSDASHSQTLTFPSARGSATATQSSLRGVPRSNVATRAIESDLEEALADFRKKGDKSRLAARLRQLLIRVRS